MSDCYCDYDPAEFYNKRKVAARKQHACYECNGPILKGETYEYVFAKWYGDVSTCKTCPRCLSVREFLEISMPCYCWAHGSAFEDVTDQISEAYYRAGDEVRGLHFGYLRRNILADRERQELRKNHHYGSKSE